MLPILKDAVLLVLPELKKAINDFIYAVYIEGCSFTNAAYIEGYDFDNVAYIKPHSFTCAA